MKKIYLAMAVIMALSIFSGCGEVTTSKTSVQITVVSPFHSGDGNRANFENAYKAYETATGYIVNDIADQSNEAWKTKVVNYFQDGNDPDVLFYFAGPDADQLVKSGKLVSIGDIRKEYPDYASNMKNSMMPVSTADGRQYAVPVNGYWEALFVNKKVLSDCGVEIPDAGYTWDEFISDCCTIRDNGYTPIAGSLMEVPHYWFEYCTFNNGSVAKHASLPKAADDEIGKIWAAGLNDIKELYDEGFFPENTITAIDDETSLLMTENKAAFMIDGSWKVGWFQENAADISDFTITYVPAKGERRATDIIGGLSMGYYITKKAWDDPAKREACVEFVRAMTNDDVVSSFGALSVTALKNGTELADNADSLAAAAIDMTKGCTSIVSTAQDLLTPDARNQLFKDIKSIVTESMSAEEAINRCLDIETAQ